jgi:hypothetical protein
LGIRCVLAVTGSVFNEKHPTGTPFAVDEFFVNIDDAVGSQKGVEFVGNRFFTKRADKKTGVLC